MLFISVGLTRSNSHCAPVMRKRRYQPDSCFTDPIKKISIIGGAIIFIFYWYYVLFYRSSLSDTIYTQNTAEYQIKLVLNDLTQRESMIREWIYTMSIMSNYLIFNFEHGQQSIREQYYLVPDICGAPQTIRIRKYIYGTKYNVTTLDIKSSARFYQNALSFPLWPAKEYSSSANQKYERDIHECREKYARETRIYLDGLSHSFVTCNDLHHYFPWAIKGSDDPLLVEPTEPWYVFTYSKVHDGTEITVTFTARYDSVDDAISGTSRPSSGEFSIRFSSKDHGINDEWDIHIKN